MKETKFPRMHASFYVSDLAKSTQFYTAFFGQAPSKLKPSYAKYELDEPGLIISFIENAERVQNNFGHMGIQVGTPEALQQRLEAAQKQSLVSLEEQGTACCFAIQDKFWATDPDGIQWEVYYFHADAEFNDPKYEEKSAEVCCAPPKKKLNMADLSTKCC